MTVQIIYRFFCGQVNKCLAVAKREINKALKQYYNGILNEVDLKQFYSFYDPNLPFEYFLRILCSILVVYMTILFHLNKYVKN